MRLKHKIVFVFTSSWLLLFGFAYLGISIFLHHTHLLFNFLFGFFLAGTLVSVSTILLLRSLISRHPPAAMQKHLLRKHLDSLKNTNQQLKQEISRHKSAERKLIVNKEYLVRLAHYDYLTGLPNRIFFNEILNKAITHAQLHHKKLAIIFIDLDKFNDVNDIHGHAIGDAVLKEIGLRFANILRPADIIARMNGDEFIILLNDIQDAKYAALMAEKILDQCSQPLHLGGHDLYVTASLGISIYPNDGHSLEDLQKNADMAMYKAKRFGGGIYHYHTQEMDAAFNEQVKLEAALRNALANKEFVLYYQPQLNLKDGTINHLEALIRWIHPEFGLVNPAKFIPLAEETGLIMPIGVWALHEACRQNKAWQDEGFAPVTVAVNISPKQFRHQDVVGLVKNALSGSRLNPFCLQLEITETAVMDNVELAISKLKQLHDIGVMIAIDDFGMGYTSINYLRQFPVSILKIDQEFIKGIPSDPNDTAITSAIIGLGHNLGLEVVAEGVETKDQMEFLAQHNCDLVQGYYLGRPVSAAKIREQLNKHEAKVEAE